jgi:hypothetical protein
MSNTRSSESPEGYVEPWWGPMDHPDFLVLLVGEGPEDARERLARGVQAELNDGRNLGTVAFSERPIGKVEEDLPPVYAVLTDDVALSAAASRDIPVLTCTWAEDGFLLQDATWNQFFYFDSILEAVHVASDRLVVMADEAAADVEFGLAISERQHLEVVLAATLGVVQDAHVRLDPEDRALLQAAADTLRAQLASPRADRTIVGRAIHGIATFGGGLILGVAGNYLADLLQRLHVAWP